MKDKIGILVLSFDGFSELWPPFFDSFFREWKDCPFPVYLMTNEKTYDHPRVQSLKLGEDASWSDNLIKALHLIPQEYILLFYEDAFLTGIDHKKLSEAIIYTIQNQVDSLLMLPSRFKGKQKVDQYYLIHRDALYRNSLFANLIKKEVLLNLLHRGENAWQYEVIGNERSAGYNFYCVKQPLFKYHHGIVKGKWLISTLSKYKSKGYTFVRLNKQFTYMQELKYLLKLRLFNWYISLLPLPLLLWLEKHRSSEKAKYI